MVHCCPKCMARQIKKNGFVFGTQRYLCKQCGFQFTKAAPHGKDTKQKAMALSLCHLGVSAHQVAKILSVTPTTIARWQKEFPHNIPYTFLNVSHLREMEETTLKSYISQLYIHSKKNFLIAHNTLPGGYQVDLLIQNQQRADHRDQKQLMICGFGDSILEGVIHDAQTNQYHILHNNFVALSGKKLNLKWENFARHGATVLQGIRSLERHQSQIKGCDYLLLSFGSNESNFDWNQVSSFPTKKHLPQMDLDAFHQQYVRLIHMIQKMGKMPVLLSMVPVGSSAFFQSVSRGRNAQNILKFLRGDIGNIYRWHSMYNLEVFKVAQETNVPVIDITGCFLKELDYSQFLCDDGVHPNEKGHALIARTLGEFYRSYFK